MLPCNDLDASAAFYERLAFIVLSGYRPAPDEPDN